MSQRASRGHCFLIGRGHDRRVEVLPESHDLAIANGKDMHEVGSEFAVGVLDLPSVITKHNYFVALRYKFAWFEFNDVLIARDHRKELADGISAASSSGDRHVFDLR